MNKVDIGGAESGDGPSVGFRFQAGYRWWGWRGRGNTYSISTPQIQTALHFSSNLPMSYCTPFHSDSWTDPSSLFPISPRMGECKAREGDVVNRRWDFQRIKVSRHPAVSAHRFLTTRGGCPRGLAACVILAVYPY